MDTLTVKIINPKAIKLLNDLADMDLIAIEPNNRERFRELLDRLSSQSESAPSLEEITEEVEAVRSERYAK